MMYQLRGEVLHFERLLIVSQRKTVSVSYISMNVKLKLLNLLFNYICNQCMTRNYFRFVDIVEVHDYEL